MISHYQCVRQALSCKCPTNKPFLQVTLGDDGNACINHYMHGTTNHLELSIDCYRSSAFSEGILMLLELLLPLQLSGTGIEAVLVMP